MIQGASVENAKKVECSSADKSLPNENLNSVVLTPEMVSEVVGEQGLPGCTTTNQKDQKTATKSNFYGIASQISNILFSCKRTVPSSSTALRRKKMVKKAICRKTNQLIRKSKKIQSSKNFSAAKLEKCIEQIRWLQKILAELINAAASRIEELYQRFVLSAG